MLGVLGVGLDPVAGRAAAASTAPLPRTGCCGRSETGPARSRSARPRTPPRPGRAAPAASPAPPRAADPAAPGTSRLCWHRYRRPPPTLRARPDRRSYALAAPGPPATVGTTDQVHPRRQPTTTCERGPGPRVRAPPYRLRTKESAARGAPAAASMVIVVRLVSATRRPTEHHAHHDRDGRPATKGARRQARFHAAASHHLGSDRRPGRGPLHPLRPALGGGNHLRRAQDPPARPEGRAPLEDPRRRPPRGLRLPVPALRRARP